VAVLSRLAVRSVALPSGAPRVRRLSDLVEVRVTRPPAGLPAVGDELELRGVLQRPRSGAGDFDYAAYLKRIGVHALLRAEGAKRTGARRRGVAGFVDGLRRRAERGVASGLDSRRAALARGIVLGQDEQIDKRTVERFQDSGLAHLLAVSGQNVTLLAILALALFRAAGVARAARHAGVLALIAVYVPLAGAGPSIQRAGAMGAAATVALLAGRPASRWYALLLAAACTLALDPRAWLDAGWQLSFAAVVGIFIAAPALRQALAARLPAALAEGVALTVAATTATASLLAHQFGRVSVVSLAANLLALPAVAPIMWLGTIAAALGQASPPAAALVNAPNAFLLAYLDGIADWTSALPHASVEAKLGSPLGLLGAYALVAAAFLAVRRRQAGNRWRHALVPAAASLALVAGAAALAPGGSLGARPDRFAVTFLDVGQGDAILLQAPGGVDVLVDGGPPEGGIAAKLRRAGVETVDLAVLTHPQEDHDGGLEEVIRTVGAAALLDGGAVEGAVPGATHRRILAAARAAGTRVLNPRAGQQLRLGALALRVLGPRHEDLPALEPNDAALVLLASYEGLDVFLPADAESNATLGLPLRPVEVLKVAHHGSADEGLRSLLQRLQPDAAVIEVGDGNRYGHPSADTLATLERATGQVLRTDRDGDVRISLGARGPVVETGR
jgi:competence protein ComEC